MAGRPVGARRAHQRQKATEAPRQAVQLAQDDRQAPSLLQVEI